MTPIIIVTGAPGAGKTTLARPLASDLRLPLLEKDAMKETLFDALGTGDARWSTRLGGAAYDLLYTVLRALVAVNVPVCLEANLHVDVWSEKLRTLCAEHPLEVLQIVCTASADDLLARWGDRARYPLRHPGHLDPGMVLSEEGARRWLQSHGALHVPGPVIYVDTSAPDGVDYPSILTAARHHVHGTATE